MKFKHEKTQYRCDGCTGGFRSPDFLKKINHQWLCEDCIKWSAKGHKLPSEKWAEEICEIIDNEIIEDIKKGNEQDIKGNNG